MKSFNDHYANLAIVILAASSARIAFREFILKRRPFVVPELSYEIIKELENEKWFFNAILINKGTYPGIAKITKAALKIGDEEHPTIFNQEVVLVPQEKQHLAPIGHINSSGLKKVRGHEYRSNRVEISFEIQSKAIGGRKYNYKTAYDFFVDVSGAIPVFSVISQKIE
ncbi:MAG: hypothetical protein ABL890_05110 [Candidatus Peribacteraceae bacterium]